MPLSKRPLSITSLGLWILCSFLKEQVVELDFSGPQRPVTLTFLEGSLVTGQEICSSLGTLLAPRLFLNKLSAHQGDTVVLSCLVPLDTPMTRIVFCKDGKEISVQPKEGNKPVYDLPHTVSKESAADFSCRYQFKDDNNQENNSLPSDPLYLHVADGDGSGGMVSPQDADDAGGEAWPQGPAIPLWVWILRFVLVAILLVSAPIITSILDLRNKAIILPVEGEVAVGSEGSCYVGQSG